MGGILMLKELRNVLIDYYNSNNLNIPKNVSEYISNYPAGFSRQAVQKKYGLKTSEIVALINNQYTKADARKALESAISRLDYSLTCAIPNTYTSKDRLDVICNKCGYINNTTLDSLRGSSKGCVKCTSGNLSWNKRKEELEALLLDEFNAELISSIPENQTGYIEIKHLNCGTVYRSQLVGIVSPNTKLRGTCPTCRDTDRRVVHKSITFGSQFEANCFDILEHFNPEMHVPYSKYINTARKWVCDFKIKDTWIEVSSFKTDYKGYFANLEDKQIAVENAGFSFFFFNSIKELKEFAELL